MLGVSNYNPDENRLLNESVKKLQRLIKEGKFMDPRRQRDILQQIDRLVDRPLIENIQRRDLIGRKIIWNSLVSVVAWRSFDGHFQSLFRAFWNAIERDSGIFDSRRISNMLNCVSKSQLAMKHSVMETIALKIDPRLGMNGQDVANSLNALSKLRDLDQCQIKSAIICLAEMINPRLNMDGQHVANSLNALSKLRDLEERQIKSAIICLAEMIHPRLRMESQGVANSLNALSKLRDLEQREIKSAIICLAEMIHPRLGMESQHVANSLNALSKMRDLEQREIKSAIFCLAQMINATSDMNNQGVANSLKALGICKAGSESTINILLQRIIESHSDDMDFGDCLVYSHNLWSQCHQDLTQSLMRKLAAIQSSDSSLLYALMGYTMIPAMSKAAVECLQNVIDKKIRFVCNSDDDIDRSLRFVLWFQKQTRITAKADSFNLLELKAQFARMNHLITESRFQHQVRNCLDQMEPGKWQSEVQCPDTLYSLDLVRDRTVIEVDGPSHFIWGRKVSFATMIKREILSMYGWRVISVPFFDWDPLQSQSERLQYLSKILN